MDSLSARPDSTAVPPAHLPAWALPRGREAQEADAAFAAIALKSLDDFLRADPAWAGDSHDVPFSSSEESMRVPEVFLVHEQIIG
jgi:hypothetical protein